MTTEAHEVTTTDELRHLFVGGVRTCFRVMWTCGNCEGTPDDHRSSRGDNHRRASPSFCWRCGWRTCFPKVFCGHVETARGRQMTTEAHEVTTTDELRHIFVGGVRTCFRVMWTCGNCEGTPDDHRSSRGDDRRRASPSFGWRCGWRTCFPKVFCGHLELRGDA